MSSSTTPDSKTAEQRPNSTSIFGLNVSQWFQNRFSTSSNNCLNLETDDLIGLPPPALEDYFIHFSNNPQKQYEQELQRQPPVNNTNNQDHNINMKSSSNNNSKSQSFGFLIPTLMKVVNEFMPQKNTINENTQNLVNNTSDNVHEIRNRRNSISLPSSPQSSPKLEKRKYVNRYFASPFVQNEDLPNHSAWLRSTLFAVRDKNYYSSDDLSKEGGLSAEHYQISSEYRELNLACPTSM